MKDTTTTMPGTPITGVSLYVYVSSAFQFVLAL